MTPIASTGASTTSRIACSSSKASVLKSGATALLSIAALLLSATSAQAVDYTWDPTSSDSATTEGAGNWDTTTTNWTTDVGVTNEVGGTGSDPFNEDLIFGGGTLGTAGTVTLTETGNDYGSIEFLATNAGTYTIDLNGNEVELKRSGNTFLIGEDATITDIAGGGTLTLNGSRQFNFTDSSKTLSISAVIAGGGGTYSVGTGGTLDLSGVNTFTSDLTLNNQSQLVISGAGQLGSGSYAGNITMNQGTDFTYASSADQTLSGIISDDGTGNGSNDVNVSGSGTLTLTGTNTYTGRTNISTTLEIQNSEALGTGLVVLTGGGELQFGADALDLSEDVLVQNSGDNRTIRLDLAGTNTGTLSGELDIRRNGAQLFDIDVGADDTLSVTSVIIGAGSAGLTKEGDGTLIIEANSTYTGATTVNGGTLEISATAGSNNPDSSSYQINNGSTLFLNETTANNLILGVGVGDITFGSSDPGGTLQLFGNTIFRNQTITTTGGAKNFITGSVFNLQNSRSIIFDTAVGTDVDGIDLEVSATISGGDIIKNGAGTVSITNSANSLGTQEGGGAGEINTVTINAGTLEVGGAGRLQSGSYAGAITNAGIFKYNSTNDQTLSGVISGTGALTQSGAATLTLSGANTYTGATTVSAGTLQLGGSLSSTSAISIASGATFSVNQVGTVTQGTEFSSTISGSGTLAVEGGGTVALTSVADTINISVAADSFLDLSSGNINVGAINLGAGLVVGEWGATGSGAANESDRITGSGTITSTASPTSYAWDGEGTDADWSTAENWVGDAVPLTDTEVIFAGTAQASTTNGLTDYVANGIQFTNTGAGESFTLAGNAINLTGDITTADAAGTIDDSIALGLQLTGGDRTISTGTDHNLAISGAISEDGSARGLSKAGTGTLTLAGSNTYAGETAVTAGVLSITNAASLGTTAAGTTVAAVSQLAISGGITVAEPLSLNGNGNTNNSGALLSSGANTVSGQITINNGGVRINTVDGSAPLTVTGGVVDAGTAGSDSTFAGNFVFNSAIDVGDFNIRVAGSGTAGQGTATEFQLNTTGNVWGNATVFFDGSVKLGVSDAIAATSTMVFGWTAPEFSTSKLDLNGFDQTLASIATTDVTDDGSNMSITDSTGTGTLTLNQATDTTYTGRFTGAMNLVKAGVGTLTLNNRSGTIPLGGDSDSSNTGSTTINAGTLEVQSGVDIGDTSVVTIDASASLNVNGTTNTETIGGLVGSGTVNIGTGNTLNVANAAAASDTFAGVLAGGGGLTKAGASDSTLTLSGVYSSYVGNTTVSAGTLQIGGSGTLKSGNFYAGDIAIASGAVFQYSSDAVNNNNKYNGAISGLGTLIKDGKDSVLRLQGITTVANIEINQGTLRVQGSADALGGASTTVTIGASGSENAILNYSGNSVTYTTKTAIVVGAGSSGTKTIQNNGTSNVENTAITLNDNVIIDDSGAFTLGGVISESAGSFGLTKINSGTTTLSGANTYTGNTTVSAGTLSMTTTKDLSDASTVSIATGAVLNLAVDEVDDVAVLNFAGVAQADGTYDSTNSGGLITGSGSIRVGGEQPTNDVASWAATFTASDASFTGSPATDPLTDYDNDGLSNLLEYVLGGSPIANQDTAVPTVSQDATHMIFTYNRSDISTATGNDVTIKAEYAADLSGSWTEAVNGTASVVIEEDTSADPDVVTVKVPLAGTEQFIRLNVVTGP